MKLRNLKEAPIGDINMMGNWERNHSFRDQDRKLLNNPKAITKLRQKWSKTHEDFQLFFINHPDGSKWTEEGEVTLDWLQQNMPRIWPELAQLNEYGQGIRNDAINILYTNNKGAEKVPMTPWIVAHRFGHAVRRVRGMNSRDGAAYAYQEADEYLRNGTNDILINDYGIPREQLKNYESEKIYRSFWESIGVFRSAREKNLRQDFEMLNELIAQYIITGGIRFNPLPPMFTVQGQGWGNKRSYRLKNPEDTADVDSLARTMEYALGDILSQAVGRIYVM